MRIGLPKGRLTALSSAAQDVAPNVLPTAVQSWLFRVQDIAPLVGEGLLDAGIVPEEWVRESGADVVRIAPVCWSHVRVCVLTKPGHRLGTAPRIVSEYEGLATGYAQRHYPGASVRRIHGACEAYVPGLADLAIDCVETGGSIERHGLVIAEELFHSDVWLIAARAVAGEAVERLRGWARLIAIGDAAGCSWQNEDVGVAG